MSAHEMSLLYQVSRRLNSDLDIQRVLADVIDVTVQHVGASNGSIIIFDESGTVAHKMLARMGMPPEKEQAVVADVLSQGLAGWVIEHQQSVVVNNVLNDSRWLTFQDDNLIAGSAISVPLRRNNQAIGVLTLRHAEVNHFARSDLELMTAIADQAAIAVQNARLYHSVLAERARMAAIIDGAGDAILVTNEQGDLLLMNTLARQAFGITDRASLAGRHMADLAADSALAELWAHRDNTASPATGEVLLADGRTFHAHLGRVSNVGYVAIMQDISDLKALNQMKTEFVSAVSHDLRSPLQLICAYASMVGEAGYLNNQQREFITGINRGVAKITTLIDDLLDLSRVESGVDMERTACYLDQIIRQVAWRFETAAGEQGLVLQCEIPSPLPPVLANESRIDQVLSNLIENAIKYTPQGHVTIRAAADEGQVTVWVVDSGIGLTSQEQNKVFEKFYRVKNEMTHDIEGTGLGLSIAKSIIEQHGGSIWVQSAWQQGSTFAFSLPQYERG